VRAARPDGAVADGTLAAAAVAGVDEVYRSAAPRPSPPWPTAPSRSARSTSSSARQRLRGQAKREVAGQRPRRRAVAFAGPSEVVVVADASRRSTFAAIDVVLQAEHGPDGLAWLITWDEAVADAVATSRGRHRAASPRRADIEATLAEGGYAVLVDGPSRRWRGQRHRPRAPRAAGGRPRGACCRSSATPARCSAGRGRRRRWATTSPGPATCCPPTARPASPARCTVDDFCKHVHVVTLDEAACAAVGPTSRPGRGRGPRRPRRVGPPRRG
jgi:histidinol dehydrogenase